MAQENIETKGKRGTWGHKSEFILASIGLAVGLGNIWRFPYLCQRNGGGAFLIPYVIFMVIEGLPIFFIEFAIGQRFRTSSVNAWAKVSPALKGIGWSCVCVSTFVCIYYIVVLSWCIYYFLMSFTSDLPWDIEQTCLNNPQYQTILNNVAKYKGNATELPKWIDAMDSFSDCCVRDPAQWYFYQRVLRVSSGIEDTGVGLNVNLVGCLILAWIITYLCVVKGIKSSGKVVYFTAVFPYIVLLIFFFRGVTLDNAKNGIKTFFNPDWSKLEDPQIWMDAATQIFFTLSLGFGALVAFASYMPIKNNCIRDAYTVVFINCGTSVFAGVVVFSILGYRELKTGLPADKVSSGPGLAFMAFSDAILLMKGSPFWAVMFFLMLILLGIDSEFGVLEATITPFYDSGVVKMRKEVFTAIFAFVMFLIGLCLVAGNGFYIFQIFDDFSVSLPLLFIAFFQCIGVTWIYGSDNFANDIEYMTGSRPNIFWMLCWKYISPVALLVVFITNINTLSKDTAKYAVYTGCPSDPLHYQHAGASEWLTKVEYPPWGQFLIVLVVGVSFLPILIYLFLDLYRRPGAWKAGIKKRFFTSWHEYLPDPAMFDASRRKTTYQMEEMVLASLENDKMK
ncbi:sodium-dependent neutral amino acid transporter B(0)AT3-like isoform X1 [Clytia hemisphaerica]|uniref:Transporter n=1 Tax=Clytia hemisphaerica TaxID=252671 RepID=A0A7M5XNE1_9CNID